MDEQPHISSPVEKNDTLANGIVPSAPSVSSDVRSQRRLGAFLIGSIFVLASIAGAIIWFAKEPSPPSKVSNTVTSQSFNLDKVPAKFLVHSPDGTTRSVDFEGKNETKLSLGADSGGIGSGEKIVPAGSNKCVLFVRDNQLHRAAIDGTQVSPALTHFSSDLFAKDEGQKGSLGLVTVNNDCSQAVVSLTYNKKEDSTSTAVHETYLIAPDTYNEPQLLDSYTGDSNKYDPALWGAVRQAYFRTKMGDGWADYVANGTIQIYAIENAKLTPKYTLDYPGAAFRDDHFRIIDINEKGIALIEQPLGSSGQENKADRVWLGIYDLNKNRIEFYPATSQAGASFRNVSWQPEGDYVIYTPSASGVSDTLNIFNMATKKVSRIKRDSPGLFKTIMWVNDDEFISPVDNQYERCSVISEQCRVIYDAAS